MLHYFLSFFAAPIERALLNLDKETGVSIMKITHGRRSLYEASQG